MKLHNRGKRGGMAIVLVHWFIKPDESAVKEFLAKWTSLEVVDKKGLFGEFMSAPVPAADLEFPSTDRGASSPSPQFWEYINVGLWIDAKTFHEQVGKYMREAGDNLWPFEAALPQRTILEPQEWHLGTWTPNDS